jgi:hypothetical protein
MTTAGVALAFAIPVSKNRVSLSYDILTIGLSTAVYGNCLRLTARRRAGKPRSADDGKGAVADTAVAGASGVEAARSCASSSGGAPTPSSLHPLTWCSWPDSCSPKFRCGTFRHPALALIQSSFLSQSSPESLGAFTKGALLHPLSLRYATRDAGGEVRVPGGANEVFRIAVDGFPSRIVSAAREDATSLAGSPARRPVNSAGMDGP